MAPEGCPAVPADASQRGVPPVVDDRDELSSDPTDPYLGAEPPERFGGEIGDHLQRTRLAGLFLQSPAFMAVTRGPEHVFVNANPTYLGLVGGRDVLGRSVRSAFPELEGQGFVELLDKVYETADPYVGSEETVRLARDGELEELYVCYSFHPLLEDGEPWGILIHGIDVTERVRSRETIRARHEAGRAQSLLEAAFHGLSDAAFVVHLPDRTVEWCNRAAAEMFGYPEEGLEGKETRILHVDEESYREFGEMSERALREEGVFRGEFEMRRADGTTFPTEHAVSWVEGEGQEPERAVSMVRDISERKQQEDALQRSRELLQRYAAHMTRAREEERREVAREIHDELGQTLTAVKMKLEEVAEETAAEGTRRGLAEAMEMVRSTLGQVRSLSTSLRPEVLDELGLGRALSLLVDRFRDQSGVEAALELPDTGVELPSGNRIHVYRVVQEALTNAARHAEPHRVVVRLEVVDGDLICRVEDDGVGLGGEDPLESPESRGVLGMQERAHLLGGQLSISERPAGGTEVRLRVPLAASGTEAARA